MNLLKQVDAARSTVDDALLKYRFKVTFGGYLTGACFQSVSGLSREMAVTEYAEGCYEHTQKLPGRETVGEITLSKGVFVSKDMEQAYKRIFDNHSSRGTVSIELHDRFGNIQRTWTLAEAWVSRWELEDLDGSSSDVAIETLTIQAEYFSP